MITKLLSLIHISVYVVIAYDTDRLKNKEVKVFLSLEKAQAEYHRLQPIYGVENVAYYSRAVL